MATLHLLLPTAKCAVRPFSEIIRRCAHPLQPRAPASGDAASLRGIKIGAENVRPCNWQAGPLCRGAYGEQWLGNGCLQTIRIANCRLWRWRWWNDELGKRRVTQVWRGVKVHITRNSSHGTYIHRSLLVCLAPQL